MTFEERERLVHVSYEAWNRGDFDVLFAIYQPECEWDNRRLPLPDIPPVSRGHEGMAEFHRVSMAPFGGHVAVAVLEVAEAGADRVLVVARWEGTTAEDRGQALAVVPPFAQIVEFRDGRIARVEFFPDVAEARRASATSSR